MQNQILTKAYSDQVLPSFKTLYKSSTLYSQKVIHEAIHAIQNLTQKSYIYGSFTVLNFVVKQTSRLTGPGQCLTALYGKAQHQHLQKSFWSYFVGE